MTRINAASVTREVKKQLRLAGLPTFRVNTCHTRLATPIADGQLWAWQSFVHDLDENSIEVVELIMGNVPNLLEVSRPCMSSSFLSVIVADR